MNGKLKNVFFSDELDYLATFRCRCITMSFSMFLNAIEDVFTKGYVKNENGFSPYVSLFNLSVSEGASGLELHFIKTRRNQASRLKE